MNLNEKIKSLLTTRQMTPSHFADEIGVQRSSISHILSGRNRPSLEIIQRIVNRFPDITYEWLLDAEEPYSTQPVTLPVELNTVSHELGTSDSAPSRKKSSSGQGEIATHPAAAILAGGQEKVRSIQRILVFYNDHTFAEYTPAVNA